MTEQYLVHYGVQGMRWGVHKQEEARGPGLISRLKSEHAQTKAAKKREYLDSTNYVKKKRAAYLTAKAKYKSLKKSRADKADVKDAKANMRTAKNLFKAQTLVGQNQELNARYASKGGARRAFKDWAITGNVSSVNRQLNLGHSYVKSMAKATVGTVATTAAVNVGVRVAAPLIGAPVSILLMAAKYR